jgi:hydroxyproline oxidase
MLRYAATFKEFPRVMDIIHRKGEKVIVDYAKENCKLSEAYEIAQTTKRIITSLPMGSMCAIKLTSFGSRESESDAKDYAHSIIKHAKSRKVKVCIDAEDVLYPEICYTMMAEHNTKEDVHVYKTYQMYRKLAMQELLCDIDNAHKDGFKIGAKLVRGAYLNKQPGLLDTKACVDNQYMQSMAYSLVCPHVHTILATHNERSLRYAKRFDKEQYVTAQLLGMGKNLGIEYRYVPVGSLYELTPYLLRRLKERMSWD